MIGFVTSSLDRDLTEDDRLAVRALANRGVQVQPVVWDEAPPPPGFDLLVLRSCWNYHLAPDRFSQWISAVRTPLANAANVVIATLDKGYLLDLAQRGVAIPETLRFMKGDPIALFQSTTGWVVKPAISVNGVDTYRFDDPAAAVARATQLTARGPVLVQRFMPEIAEGELSFVFFAGHFSHALRKVPRRGEFRVQVEHGGRREAYTPSPTILAQAEAILRTVPPLLYARVDCVVARDRLVLIELEAIDPMLFFAHAEGAAERFAEAVITSRASRESLR